MVVVVAKVADNTLIQFYGMSALKVLQLSTVTLLCTQSMKRLMDEVVTINEVPQSHELLTSQANYHDLSYKNSVIVV